MGVMADTCGWNSVTPSGLGYGMYTVNTLDYISLCDY
jgi:hypothetical protein